ncbi:hypothetical protein [Acidisphaera sp. L21]|uniref:hypothetical protein n=1 Tax=Acidisphaera sp. L21 TaxID=1641851 RepID=UPI00131A802F|nr:hypothetical protein [Acidisphaera sp. L21]
MRETLGLTGRGRPQIRSQPTSPTANKQRHRFVQDGEVPVIHLSPGNRDSDSSTTLRARITTLESALETEQAARARADQSVNASLAQIHALETKLAHIEIAAQETLATERTAREQAETALQTALHAREHVSEQLVLQPTAYVPDLLEAPQPKERPKRTPRVAKPKTPRVSTARVKEPQPVKWWLNTTKAKTTKR